MNARSVVRADGPTATVEAERAARSVNNEIGPRYVGGRYYDAAARRAYTVVRIIASGAYWRMHIHLGENDYRVISATWSHGWDQVISQPHG